MKFSKRAGGWPSRVGRELWIGTRRSGLGQGELGPTPDKQLDFGHQRVKHWMGVSVKPLQICPPYTTSPPLDVRVSFQ